MRPPYDHQGRKPTPLMLIKNVTKEKVYLPDGHESKGIPFEPGEEKPVRQAIVDFGFSETPSLKDKLKIGRQYVPFTEDIR